MKPSDAQIESMRERAHGLLTRWSQGCRHPDHNTDCDEICDALATVAIEAAAKGARDERAYWLTRARSRNAQYVTVEEMQDDHRGAP